MSEKASTNPETSETPRIEAAGREFEFKFIADDALVDALKTAAILGQNTFGRVQHLISTYFDTASGALDRNHIALRMRRKGRRWLQCLKWSHAVGGLAERGEQEVVSPEGTLDLTLFEPQTQAFLADLLEGESLIPQFTTDVRRSTCTVPFEGANFELALDKGHIIAGEDKEVIRELEVELLDGPRDTLYRFIAALSHSVPLRLSPMSKAVRGHMLVDERMAPILRATHAPEKGIISAEDLIGAAIMSCIDQFVGNWPAFLRNERPESIHQMRVAMRRLRALLAAFNKIIPCTGFEDLRLDAKRMASAMGPARNWDVFGDLVRSGPRHVFVDDPGLPLLIDAVKDQRQSAYDEVRAMLNDPRTTNFVLAAEHFVITRGWRTALDFDTLFALKDSPRAFAAECLARRDRKIRRDARKLATMSSEARHDVRLALKTLRYLADYFAPLFGTDAKAKAYARAAAGLQDVLGVANDSVMTLEVLPKIECNGNIDLARATGLVLGWYGQSAHGDLGDIRQKWRAFRKCKPFWTQG